MELVNELLRIFYQQMDGISLKIWLLSVVAGIGILEVIFFGCAFKTGQRIKKRKRIIAYLFILYFCFLIQITFLNRDEGSRIGINLSYSFLLGQGISLIQAIYDFFNIVLFVPYGCLLFFLLEGISKKRKSVIIPCISYLTSMGIEILQTITGRGFFEISDLVMNSIGGIIGVALAVGALRLFEKY